MIILQIFLVSVLGAVIMLCIVLHQKNRSLRRLLKDRTERLAFSETLRRALADDLRQTETQLTVLMEKLNLLGNGDQKS